MRLPFLAAVLAAATLPAGCSVLQQTRRADVGPFAENTMKLVSDVNPGASSQQILFIRPYLPVPAGPKLGAEWATFQQLLRAVVEYASQVLAISESSLEDAEKPRELARYLDVSLRPVLEREQAASKVAGQPLDQLVKKVRSETALLGALRAAQPAVDDLLTLTDFHAGRIRELQGAFAADVGGRIDEAYSKVIANLRELEALQQQAMESYTLVARARLGSADSLATVRARDAGVRDVMGKEAVPGRDRFDAAEAELAGRLARIEKLRDQIGPEIELYVRTKAELNRLMELSEENATRGRLAVIAFARSHRNLAAGLPVPPEIDILGTLKSSAGGAASKLLP
jgi:hypothetical protein